MAFIFRFEFFVKNHTKEIFIKYLIEMGNLNIYWLYSH